MRCGWAIMYFLESTQKKPCFSKRKPENLLILSKLSCDFLKTLIGDCDRCLLSYFEFCEKSARWTFYPTLGTQEITFTSVPWNRTTTGTQRTPWEVVCTTSQRSPLVKLFNRRWLVNHTAQWLHAEELVREKSLSRRLDGLQTTPEHCGEHRNTCRKTVMKLWTISRPTRNLVTILPEVLQRNLNMLQLAS
jgi:hypothetical protein